jgi:pyoverdine/dityrosine biosynthesis protein Dit1
MVYVWLIGLQLNRENKVLGHLPDLGEELALRRLNAMAESVKEVYEFGAVVNIASDGVLFNGKADMIHGNLSADT